MGFAAFAAVVDWVDERLRQGAAALDVRRFGPGFGAVRCSLGCKGVGGRLKGKSTRGTGDSAGDAGV